MHDPVLDGVFKRLRADIIVTRNFGTSCFACDFYWQHMSSGGKM